MLDSSSKFVLALLLLVVIDIPRPIWKFVSYYHRVLFEFFIRLNTLFGKALSMRHASPWQVHGQLCLLRVASLCAFRLEGFFLAVRDRQQLDVLGVDFQFLRS